MTHTTTTLVGLNEVNEDGADGVPGLGVDEGLWLAFSVIGGGVGAEVGSSRTGASIDAWGNDWVSMFDMAATLEGLVRVDSRDAIETLAAWLTME